jgi:acetyl-CoA carboxylase carboxyl transferase subunit beta
VNFSDFFYKKKYATVSSNKFVPTDEARARVPEGVVNKCPKCYTPVFMNELEKNLFVCTNTKCAHHFRINARKRLELTFDDGQFVEFDAAMHSVDPLEFPGYKEKLAKHQAATGFKDAIISGQGTIHGIPVVAAAMSFEFFGGSMGSVVGEKIARAMEQALAQNIPFIMFSTSGGARMEESILSLMQMAKTSAILHQFEQAGLLYISVFTDPTLGGVTASFAMLGDIILAEPGTIIGFTGRRVIEQTIRQVLPENFQKAETNLGYGQIDKIVSRQSMRETLKTILELHQVREV